MAAELCLEWIQIALENGGHLGVSYDTGTIIARMRWRNGNVVMSKDCKTIYEALDSLDTDLAEDAAQEMCDSGVV